MALEAHDTRWLQKIGVVLSPVDVVAAKAGHAMRVHGGRNKIVTLHAILMTGTIWKMCERRLAQLVFFQFPKVLQIQPYMKSDGPVVVLTLDRARQRLALGVALNTDVVGLNVVQTRWIHNV